MGPLLLGAPQMGRGPEQLWRLRGCRAGTRGLVPDFSHPLPTAAFVILSSPSTFLSRSFCTNLLSIQPFAPLSPHRPDRSSSVPSSENVPTLPIHNTPWPWALTHSTLLSFPQNSPLCVFCLPFTLVHCVSPARTRAPGGQGLGLSAPLAPGFVFRGRTVLPHRTCGRTHRAWSSCPALSSEPFPAGCPRPCLVETCPCLKCFLSGSPQSSAPAGPTPFPVWPPCLTPPPPPTHPTPAA